MFVSILIFILTILIIAGSCATDQMKYISKDYEIYGTWINSDYNDSGKRGKVVYYPNGEYELYFADTDATVTNRGEFVISNKWIDSKGNIYYTIISKVIGELLNHYELFKISNSG
jgi:hypothetical protein